MSPKIEKFKCAECGQFFDWDVRWILGNVTLPPRLCEACEAEADEREFEDYRKGERDE